MQDIGLMHIASMSVIFSTGKVMNFANAIIVPLIGLFIRGYKLLGCGAGV